jgi:autotransporter-associated beta strand protein/T5SS/PEP-CTERM-associated repeat protein
LIVTISVAFGGASAGLSAADIQWAGTTSTDWKDPTNWVGGVLPGASDNAHLDVSGGTTDIDPFSDPGFNTTIQQLYVGDANPNATLTQSSGTLNLNGAQAWLKIGAQGGSSGIYNLQGTGVLSLSNDVFGIGEHGVGSFNLSDSAQASAPRVALGRYAEGRGTVFQTDGSTLNVTGNGNDGNGTPNYALAIGEQSTSLSNYTITGGTLNVSGGDCLIGMTAGSNGRMTVVGAGTAVSAGHEVRVGDRGTGALVIGGGQFTSAGQMIVGNAIGSSGSASQAGGTLGLTGGSLLVIGNQAGAVGSFTLSGGTLNASGRILVGEDGLGSFTQTGGANNVTQDISIGDHVGFSTISSPDTYAISAGTLSAASLQIGWQGYAAMNQSGGTVTTTTDVHFGGSANGNAQNGRGIYNLSGGTLVTPSIFVSSAGNMTHQFNFIGGTLRVANYNTTGATNVLGMLVQTSTANPSLLDVTTQTTTIGTSYSLNGQTATAAVGNGNTLHVQGILSIDGGAAVIMSANPANQLFIDGSGSNPNNSVNVGVGGIGQLTIGGGTVRVAAGDVFIGQNSGANGLVAQNGGFVSLHAASPNWLFVGRNAGSQGTYNLVSGSLAEPNNEEIGYGGTGAFTQTGGTDTAGNVVLGGQTGGSGTYSLNGGTLIARSVSGGPGASSFNFNGGTLQPSASNAAFFQGFTNAIVQNGGALIDTGGSNVTVAQSLFHDPSLGATSDGGLVKSGAGTLTFSGANTYNGGTTVTSGSLITTPSGTLGPGALAVNAANGVSSTATLGSSQSVSALSSAVSGTGVATLNIAANTTLTVNQSNNTTFAGTIVNSGTLATSANGILEIDGPPVLAVNSSLQANGGTLRFSLTSGSPIVGSGTTATIASGATLELAGSVSALSSGPNRVNIMNNSQAPAGGLVISGSNQQVGAIDGSGNSVLAADASLTSNHIIQNALVIGGSSGHPATMIIAASDSLGNSFGETNPLTSDSSSSIPRTEWPQPSDPSAVSIAGNEAVSLPSASAPAVSEPSSLSLVICGTVLAITAALRRMRKQAAQ